MEKFNQEFLLKQIQDNASKKKKKKKMNDTEYRLNRNLIKSVTSK